MAPKGGGHGGGSSSGGSSGGSSGSGSRSSSGYSSSSSSVWTRKAPLPGTNWTYGPSVALVVFAALFLATLIAIRIWAGSVKKKQWSTNIWKTVMGKRWGVAIWFGLLFYAWQLIERILHEETVTVANIYYIFEFILLSVAFIAEIALLLVVYTLLYQCFLHPNGPSDTQAKTKKQVYLAHVGLCGLLSVLYLAFLALGIKDIVTRFQRSGSSLYARILQNTYPDYLKISLAYTAIFFVANLEIVAASVYLFVTKSKRGLSTTTVALLVGLVAIPYFIRTIFFLGFSASQYNGHNISLSAYAAEDFITGAAHMVTYLGVVLVVAAVAKLGPAQPTVPGAQPGLQDPPMMAQPGAPPPGQPYYQAQYYPPQQQYGVPPQQQYGQEVKAFNGGSPPQGYYPPPQPNGFPGQNGAPPQGFVPQQQQFAPPPQQQYSPPPQQQYSPPPQQPGLVPQQPTQTSPVSSASPQNTTITHSQHGSELPSTHY